MRPLYVILATLMLDAIGIGIVFPILPDLMLKVGAEDTATGSLWGGLLLAAYAFMQFVCGPAVGGVSDAFGRRPVLIGALVILTVDYVVMAMAETYWLLLVGRLLAGMAGATYITATAYLADISSREERAANFGLIGAAFGVGFVLGPALGGLAATISVTAPFWIAAGLAFVNVIFAWFILPESLAAEKRRPFARRDLNPLGAIAQVSRLPGLALPLTLIFLFEFANMVYPTLWAYWGRAAFGFSAQVVGLSLAAYGLGVAFTQAVVMPRAIGRLGEYGTLVLALACGLIAMVAYGFASAAWVVFAFLPFACLSDMAPPTLTAMSANMVEDDRQGLLQGVIASLAAICAIVAPLAMTALFWVTADREGAVYMPGATYLASALLVGVVLFLAPRLRAKAGEPVPSPQDADRPD